MTAEPTPRHKFAGEFPVRQIIRNVLMRKILLNRWPIALALLMLVSGNCHGDPTRTGASVPAEARALILRVHSAAKQADYTALQQLMVRDFVWSFGGDEDAAQAIEAWKSNPVMLQQLYRITGKSCAYDEDGIVQCPNKVGTGHRAGFMRTQEGWRMIYFVVGD